MDGSIYKLINPATKKAVYVGSTKRPLAERLKEHVYSIRRENAPVYDFLHSNGIFPEIELLEKVEVENSKELRKKEEEWTERLIVQGEKLFNPNRLGSKCTGSIRVDWRLFEIARKYSRENGLSIGKFYDIAVRDKLISLSIIDKDHSFPSER